MCGCKGSITKGVVPGFELSAIGFPLSVIRYLLSVPGHRILDYHRTTCCGV